MRTLTQKPFNSQNEPTQQADVILQSAILETTIGIYNKTPSDEFLAWLKADCLELITLIDKAAKNPLQSRFNVIGSTQQVMAKSVSFTRAKGLQNKSKSPCLIKFAGMVEVLQ